MVMTASNTGSTQALPDDLVLPFGTVRSRVSGRIVRLGSSVDTVLTAHDYPAAVSEALGQAHALDINFSQQYEAVPARTPFNPLLGEKLFQQYCVHSSASNSTASSGSRTTRRSSMWTITTA